VGEREGDGEEEEADERVSFLYEPSYSNFFLDHFCIVNVEVIKAVIGSWVGTWLARLADPAWLSRQTWPVGAAQRLVELPGEAKKRASGGL
jgi:hypothetical protein